VVFAVVLCCGSALAQHPVSTTDVIGPDLLFPGESAHLRNVRQLTFGNTVDDPDLPPANFAEAYWAPDGKSLMLQATVDGYGCDQVFHLDLLTGAWDMVGSGEGRVTCSFMAADGDHFIYSSTHEHSAECPERPDMSQGYVWPLYEDYDIYMDSLSDIGDPTNITDCPGYDAEGTIDWNSGWLYFTSTRSGDIDIYRQHLETGEVQQLTDEFGYDGGPFVSYDGQTIVYRRSNLATDEERDDYITLLSQGLIRPGQLELMLMDADGSNKRQLTDNGAANFAPFLHPDGETLIFCSNLEQPEGFAFNLYTYKLSSGEVEQVTFQQDFDGFPMFSPDGRYLVWCSNRNNGQPRETNVFIAEWVP
jgi:tricorn protease-like protein